MPTPTYTVTITGLNSQELDDLVGAIAAECGGRTFELLKIEVLA